MYLIDRPIVEADHVIHFTRYGKAAPTLTHSDVPDSTLRALDVSTGKTVWKNEENTWALRSLPLV